MGVPVVLRGYDLSRGMAATMSPFIIGKRIEAIWHTGVLVYGKEYFYGGGIMHMTPAEVEQMHDMTPCKVDTLGETDKTEEEFHGYLESVIEQFDITKYDLLHWNCNHFTDACVQFLLGKGLPAEIVKQHEEVSSSPMGSMILNMLNESQKQMQTQMEAEGQNSLWTAGDDSNPHLFRATGRPKPGTTTAPPAAAAEEASASISTDTPFGSQLAAFVESQATKSQKLACVELLHKLGSNILSRPTESKFRSLRVTNAKVAQNVLALTGGAELLEALGFVKEMRKLDGEVIEEEVFQFPSPVKQTLVALMKKRGLIETAIAILGGKKPETAPPTGGNRATPPPAGATPSYPNIVPPHMAGLAQDPRAAQALNNPMVQQALRNPDVMRQAMNLLNQGGNHAERAPPSVVAGESNFTFQLEQLAEMGFTDKEACLKALRESGGNLNAAMDKLFS